MKKYQNILCATDFSEAGNDAARRAAELAQHYGAQLTLLHVMEHFPEEASNELIAPEEADRERFYKEHARTSLGELIDSLQIQNIKQEIQVTTHSAKHEIIRFAGERNVDLVVLASHGRHGITAILGSTASGIMHSAPCDVFVVRAG